MNDFESSKPLNTDMTTALYRLAVVILLAGILIMQWQMLGKLGSGPAAAGGSAVAGPTFGEFRQSRGQDRRDMTNNIPLVRLQGPITITSGTVALDSATVAQIRR